MAEEKLSPKTVLLDEAAQSADPALPAFLSRPANAPIYHGFPTIQDTETDGWFFGAITDFLDPGDPDGCEWGDGFVIAPDGSRAGIVWATDVEEMQEIMPPEEGRWGVYGVCFPRPMRTVADLVFNFRHVLPDLQQRYQKIKTELGAANHHLDGE